MSNEMEELPPWRPLRWMVAVVLVLLLHLGGIYMLSGWTPPQPPREAAEFKVRLLTTDNAGQTLLDRYSLRDPTMFATISSNDFSFPAWLNVEPPPFNLPEWSDPQRWLTQRSDTLGDTFRQYVRANLGTTLSVAPASSEPAEPATPAPQRSTRLFVQGLPTRALTQQPDLLAWPSDFVLQPTVIEVLIDSRGWVFSPRLLNLQAGQVGVEDTARIDAQTAADRHALSLVPKLRFEPNPVGADRLDKGRVIIQWVTKATTNQTDQP